MFCDLVALGGDLPGVLELLADAEHERHHDERAVDDEEPGAGCPGRRSAARSAAAPSRERAVPQVVSAIAKPSTTKSWAIDSYGPLRSAPQASTGMHHERPAPGSRRGRKTIGRDRHDQHPLRDPLDRVAPRPRCGRSRHEERQDRRGSEARRADRRSEQPQGHGRGRASAARPRTATTAQAGTEHGRGDEARQVVVGVSSGGPLAGPRRRSGSTRPRQRLAVSPARARARRRDGRAIAPTRSTKRQRRTHGRSAGARDPARGRRERHQPERRWRAPDRARRHPTWLPARRRSAPSPAVGEQRRRTAATPPRSAAAADHPAGHHSARVNAGARVAEPSGAYAGR